MRFFFGSSVFLLLVVVSPIRAEDGQDGRDHPLKDSFLDGLIGNWQVERVMKNRTEQNAVNVEWVLNHQFVRLHYQDVAVPSKYEAMVYIGYDHEAKRYVVHWMDVFGGHFSQPLGYGQREGNALTIRFDYPDGEFRNTFTFDPKERTWTSLMRQKGKDGNWSTFAEDHFRKVEKK